MEPNASRAPRNEEIPGGGTAFIHPCSVCGSPNGFFGYGVSLHKNKPGDWRCRDHRVDKLQTVATKVQEKKSASVKPSPEPKQGDLF